MTSRTIGDGTRGGGISTPGPGHVCIASINAAPVRRSGSEDFSTSRMRSSGLGARLIPRNDHRRCYQGRGVSEGRGLHALTVQCLNFRTGDFNSHCERLLSSSTVPDIEPFCLAVQGPAQLSFIRSRHFPKGWLCDSCSPGSRGLSADPCNHPMHIGCRDRNGAPLPAPAAAAPAPCGALLK